MNGKIPGNYSKLVLCIKIHDDHTMEKILSQVCDKRSMEDFAKFWIGHCLSFSLFLVHAQEEK